jgi:choline dehydrogenase-like flavoprotein
VIGLGAAGGVAVLPLTQAGIDVVGLEARHLAHQARLRAG